MTNERGFGLVGVLACLPFLLALVASVCAFGLYFLSYQKLTHACRTKNLSLQRQLASSLDQLLSLNPSVRRLRRRARDLQRALRLSPPQFKPPILAALAAVKTQQALLGAQQRRLTLSATAQKQSGRLALIRTLRSEGASGVSVHLGFWQGLPVYPDRQLALASVYKLYPRYQSRHAVSVHWEMNLSHSVPRWIQEILTRPLPDLEGQCSATIIRNQRNSLASLWRARH